jgi:hypothetical protein
MPSSLLSRAPWALPALLLAAWLCALAFILPYDPDEAVYSIIASGIVDGRWPYRDLFDHKPPLLYAVYLPAGLGASIEAMRVIAAVCVAASFAPLWAIARRWLGERERKPAMAAYALALANPFLIIGANAEAFLLLPLVSAVAAPSPLLAGALFGCALAIKPIAIVFAPLLLLIWKRSAWQAAAGAVAVVGIISAFFVPVWGDYWDANVTFNLDYATAGSRSWWRLFGVEVSVLIGSAALWLVAAFGFGRSSHRAMLAVWLGCAVLAAKATGYDYAHYYVLLAPPVALLAGRGWVAIVDRRSAIVGATVLILGVATVGVSLAALGLARELRDEDSALSAAIREQPGEFYLAGDRSQIYATAEREPSRRVFFSVPLVVRPDWEGDAMRDIADCPPAAVAYVKSDRSTYDLEWAGFLAQLYAATQDFKNAVLYSSPVRSCDELVSR